MATVLNDKSAREIVNVALTGDYDLSTKGDLATALSPAETAQMAIIDLTETDYIDCSCLGTLLALRKKMVLFNGRADVRLAGASRQISKIFALTGLDKIFSMYSTVEEALAASPASARAAAA